MANLKEINARLAVQAKSAQEHAQHVPLIRKALNACESSSEFQALTRIYDGERYGTKSYEIHQFYKPSRLLLKLLYLKGALKPETSPASKHPALISQDLGACNYSRVVLIKRVGRTDENSYQTAYCMQYIDIDGEKEPVKWYPTCQCAYEIEDVGFWQELPLF